MAYNRILLKLSGEMLGGKFENGIDPELVGWFAREVKLVQEQGVEVVIMVGGGNFVRGAQIAGHGIRRVTGDHMGMLATMINALAVTDIFEAQDVRTRCLTSIFAQQVAEPFVYRLAEKHLANGRVVVVGGGTGQPYLTTDTAAVSLALQLDCQIVLKATKVDGVYDKDPAKFPDATRFESLHFQQAVENANIKVMDKAAMGLAMEQGMDLIIFDPMKEGSIAAVVAGENIGTKISQ
jgi:uridylate kinase